MKVSHNVVAKDGIALYAAEAKLRTGGLVGAVANASTSWGQCYQKAGEICGPRGYNILQ
jgi:hypothetical protein